MVNVFLSRSAIAFVKFFVIVGYIIFVFDVSSRLTPYVPAWKVWIIALISIGGVLSFMRFADKKISERKSKQ